MKKMKNLTEYEIINAAWNYYLEVWCEFKERAEKAEKLLGRKSEILEYKVKKYREKENELHDLLLKMEIEKN